MYINDVVYNRCSELDKIEMLPKKKMVNNNRGIVCAKVMDSEDLQSKIKEN